MTSGTENWRGVIANLATKLADAQQREAATVERKRGKALSVRWAMRRARRKNGRARARRDRQLRPGEVVYLGGEHSRGGGALDKRNSM
jgi:hypothetical protein